MTETTTRSHEPVPLVREGATALCPDDPALRERVLRPYRTHARYLLSADVNADQNTVTASCEFGIDDSCYIDSTGHFNAVEFNICYNQVAYYLIAKSVQGQLLDAFRGWTLADFWERQLSDVLLVEFSSRFRHAINPKRFNGEVTFSRARVRPRREGKAPLVIIETQSRFWDDNGGQSDGKALLALTNPPETNPPKTNPPKTTGQ